MPASGLHVSSLATLPPDQLAKALASLTEAEADELFHDWRFTARPEQVAPDGDWQVWAYIAGRGAGKTRSGAEWIREKIKAGCSRIALIAPTAGDARDVMVEGDSGILSVCWSGDRDHKGNPTGRPIYEPSKRRLTWANGAVATTYSADEPDRLRGPQHEAGWCFVAGTMVATPSGSRPIEALRPGDAVLTRAGARAVVGNSERVAAVGRVTFDNGAVLVGTGDHPVYLKSGWTRLDQLQIGDVGCALVASSGAENGGTATARGGAPTTSGQTRACALSGRGGSTERSGSVTEGRFRRASTCITSTTTCRITTSAIWSVCRTAGTRLCTWWTSLSRALTGQSAPLAWCHARTVAATFGESACRQRRDARAVLSAGRMRTERRVGSASSAAGPSLHASATSAVSVASTWRPEAERSVFCLKVAGEPEYFANGILVHNCDEIAAWNYAQEAWDMFMFGLRLGSDPQAMVTTTPRPIPLLRQIMASPNTVITRGSTYANRANLAASFLDKIVTRYEGTRLGRQELMGEMLDDVPGALWTRDLIDAAKAGFRLPEMRRIVVAVDPSGTRGQSDDGDSIGIVVVGIGVDGLAYVLADRTCKLSPDGWGRRAVAAYHEFKADRIVAERNFGGAMVEHVIRTVDQKVAYKEVTASRGKIIRAEPIAALYEQGRVKHAPGMTDLEDQMCAMTADGFIGEGSPDRVDALVWALTELALAPDNKFTWHVAGEDITN